MEKIKLLLSKKVILFIQCVEYVKMLFQRFVFLVKYIILKIYAYF